MYLPVVVMSIVVLGSIALDSRADDLDPPAWLPFNDRVFETDAPFGSTPTRPKAKPTQHHLPHRGSTASVFGAKAALAQTGIPGPRKRVIQRAHELIGTPYKWGGMSETSGFDCSGLLVYLFRSEAGIEIPRTTTSMMNKDYLPVSRHELQPGDAVFFDNRGRGRVDHVGLYIGDNRFVHAPRTGAKIRIDSLDNRYWNQRYSSARRFDANPST